MKFYEFIKFDKKSYEFMMAKMQCLHDKKSKYCDFFLFVCPH